LNLKQLQYFVRIVECGSLAKASRQLYIAQPALSQQLSKLEEEVGKTLLIRSAKGVVPTPNGAALLQHARFMLRQLEQALVIARQEPGSIQGMVSVGLASTTLCALGAPLMRRMRDKYPGIVLNIVEGLSGHIAQMMRLTQLDLAVLFGRDEAPDLPHEALLEEDLFLMLPEDSDLVAARRKSVRCDEISQLPLILPTGIHGLRRRIAHEFEQRNLQMNVVAEIDSLSLLMLCVKEGMGVTIKPMSATMMEDRMAQGLRYLPISDARLRRPNFLYTTDHERLTPATIAVHSELKATIQHLVHTGQWKGVELLSP
jgi:LysR family transcriptional regulator, regulatory protein for tcuABC